MVHFLELISKNDSNWQVFRRCAIGSKSLKGGLNYYAGACISEASLWDKAFDSESILVATSDVLPTHKTGGGQYFAWDAQRNDEN